MREKNVPGISGFSIVDSTSPEAKALLRDPGSVNLVFGAGAVGGLVLDACAEQGIAIAAFCDNNPGKTTFRGLPSYPPAKALQRHPHANILLAAVDVRQVAAQLAGLGVRRIFSAGLLSSYPPALTKPRGFGPEMQPFLTVETDLAVQNSILDYPEKVTCGWGVEIMITERCSLHCLDCANLMQYYQKPQHRPLAEVTAEIDAFCRCLDEVPELRLIGGEPLLHPDFHHIITHLTGKKNLRRVGVITNGTLIPREEQWASLADPRVYFRITDYGDLSRHRDRLAEELDRRGVNGFVIRHDFWNRWRLLARRGLGEEELRRLFLDCRNATCLTILEGGLYRCEHAANAVRLGVAPEEGNCVDLRPVIQGVADPLAVGRDIWSFVHELTMLPACDYCLGCTRESERVEPAVQTREILPLPRD